MAFFIVILLLLKLFTSLSFGAFYNPDPRISALEHILVDTDGAFRSGFKDAITPCKNYVNGPQTFGRTTAAQWVRVAFHNFVTARVDERRRRWWNVAAVAVGDDGGRQCDAAAAGQCGHRGCLYGGRCRDGGG